MKLSIKPLGCIVLLPAVASAFQPLVTDDTGTQGAGGNQLEPAYNRTVDKAPGTRDVTHEVPLVITRGITDALDLYLGSGKRDAHLFNKKYKKNVCVPFILAYTDSQGA